MLKNYFSVLTLRIASSWDVGSQLKILLMYSTILYQQDVGCLTDASNSRPNIQCAVSQLSRFMHSPGTKHWKAVKHLFGYLKGSLSLALIYGRGAQPCLHAFTDRD